MAITRIESIAIGKKISKLEPRFSEVVSLYGPSPIGVKKRRESNFESLASSVLSQQLSTKAAETIILRVKDMAGGNLDPMRLSRLSAAQLRSAGCSGAKARSISELAEKVTTGDLDMKSLSRKSNDEIIDNLLPLFGIGRWTVEMYLIFQLGRLDVWPVGDLGVRRGWEKIFKLRKEISPEKLNSLGDRFAPYRSHLAWYCWRAHEHY